MKPFKLQNKFRPLFNRRRGVLLLAFLIGFTIISIGYVGNFEFEGTRHKFKSHKYLKSELKMLRQASLFDGFSGRNAKNLAADSKNPHTIPDYVSYLKGRNLLTLSPIDPSLAIDKSGPTSLNYWTVIENYCAEPSFESSIESSWSWPQQITVASPWDFPGLKSQGNNSDPISYEENPYGYPYQPGQGYSISITIP